MYFCTIALIVWGSESGGEMHLKCSHVIILKNRMARSEIYYLDLCGIQRMLLTDTSGCR